MAIVVLSLCQLFFIFVVLDGFVVLEQRVEDLFGNTLLKFFRLSRCKNFEEWFTQICNLFKR